MVDSISRASAYAALQPFGGSAPVQPEQAAQRPSQLDLPPPPGPLERLRETIRSSEIDTEALSTRLTDDFGQGADGVVSESGVVDLDALTNLIAEERTATTRTDLAARFGDEAANFVSDRGDVDLDGLRSFAQERGFDVRNEDLEPQTGFSGAQISGYSPRGQATVSAPQNFLSIVA